MSNKLMIIAHHEQAAGYDIKKDMHGSDSEELL
jgi:hypothetical protein